MGIWDWLLHEDKPQPKITTWPPEMTERWELEKENKRLKERKQILELAEENEKLKRICKEMEADRRRREEKDNGI